MLALSILRDFFQYVFLTLAAALLGAYGGNTVAPDPSTATQILCPIAATVTSTDDGPTPVAFGNPVVTGGTAPFSTSCSPPSGINFPVGTTTVNIDVNANFRLSLLAPEGLHPSQAGYTQIAQTFFDKLKATLEVSTPSSISRTLSSVARASSATRAR